MKHLAMIQPQNPNEPDSSMPWCPACRLHTEYHLKVLFVEADLKGRPIFTPVTSAMVKRGNPLTQNRLIIVQLHFSSFFRHWHLSYAWAQDYGFTNENMAEEGLGCFVLSFFVGYFLYRNSKANRNHWKAFHKWAEAQGQR